MTKIVELRPDNNLTNLKFEKYQFCADDIPVEKEINLKSDLHRLELTTNRDSLLETRLFALHNHLFKNPYDASCWFIDEKWNVWRLKQAGDLEQIHIIHNTNENVQNLLYNPSIGFTNNRIVISDGGDCLKLLTTDNEGQFKSFVLNGVEPGVILDVQYVNTTSSIIIAMSDIRSTGEKKFTRILLLTYAQKDIGSVNESVEFIKKEALNVNGAVEYAYIEDCGKYLHSICQDYITFECPKVKESIDDKKGSEKNEEIKIPKYCWSQDEDSITVWLKVDKQQQGNVTVNVTSLELSVAVENNLLIQGQCQHRLDESLTTWKYEQDTFKLELFKHECGLMWSELIKGDTGGECLPNETLAAEIHSRLAHLCTNQADSKQEQPCLGFNTEQLEECDLEGKDNLLQRIDLVTEKNTHLAMLGTSNHVLFTYKTKSGQAICLRHDNDGCLWVTNPVDDHGKWNMEHYYTFPGFGYVEASKSNKKFCVSPANGSYVAVIEHTRYIFLYKRPETNVQVGKQWIIDLEQPDSCPIMGAVATNKYLILLTKNKLYRLNLCLHD